MYNKDYCNITRRIYISDLPLVKTLSRLMQNGVDFWLSLLPLCREVVKSKLVGKELKLALHGWIQGSLSKRHKHLQSMSSRTTSPSPHRQTCLSCVKEIF